MHALARDLSRTVGELTLTLSARDYARWRAYHRISPIGDLRGDIQAGIVASTIANVHRAKHTRAFTPQEFMLYTRTAPITDEEIERKIDAFMTRYG